MHDTWMERLSEYLDGGMDRDERQALEAHLRECAECSAVLADLEKVRGRARDLNDTPLPREIWPRIENAITPSGMGQAGPGRITRLGLPPKARRFSLPELLAACLAVALVSGGTMFAVLHQGAAPVPSRALPTAQAPAGSASPSPREAPPREIAQAQPSTEHPSAAPAEATPAARPDVTLAAQQPGTETPHEEAIVELRRALASKRDQLDPATIRTLETNLAIIDLAIDQAKRALVADSANTYVKEHLADTIRRKVELLQRATVLASTSSLEGSR